MNSGTSNAQRCMSRFAYLITRAWQRSAIFEKVDVRSMRFVSIIRLSSLAVTCGCIVTGVEEKETLAFAGTHP